MRFDNGMRFDHCIGLQDRDESGKIFDANTLICRDKPLSTGESIMVGGRAHQYIGDDNLGNSIFIALEPFPAFETLEEHYRDNLYIVLELYPRQNGRYLVRPYVQSGPTSSDHWNREGFMFSGEFETKEAAVVGGMKAARERIEKLYTTY